MRARGPDICIYFEAHQPNRLRPYSFFDIGVSPFYEDDARNGEIVRRVADHCYRPANAMFQELAEKSGGKFKIALSISGVLIEQFEHHCPDVLESFVALHDTGCVELLCETYYHSLCFRASGHEFARQVKRQQKKLKSVFGAKPKVFRHTELVYFNELAAFVEGLGFKGMLAEGVDRILKGRSPNYVYRSPNVKKLKTLTRNSRLSDDLGFRFADSAWSEHPLTAEKFAGWIAQEPGDVVNLFLNYETIGEHQSAESGIFDFWRAFPAAALAAGCRFVTPSQAIKGHKVAGGYDCHEITSWADVGKDLSPWKANPMQYEAKKKILAMRGDVKACKDKDFLHQWSKMQTSDHFYYMSTKGGDDGAVHGYFRPYASPFDAYVYFMNALSDLQVRAQHKLDERQRRKKRAKQRRGKKSKDEKTKKGKKRRRKGKA